MDWLSILCVTIYAFLLLIGLYVIVSTHNQIKQMLKFIETYINDHYEK